MDLLNLGYIAASILFIIGLKLMGQQATARKGNAISAVGMLIAVVVTLLQQGMEYHWIVLGLLIGTIVGATLALRVQMTGMPEMVALLNGFGGAASLLVAWSEYHSAQNMPAVTAAPTFLAVLVGGVTFTGSLVAYGKLSELISGKPVQFPGQLFVNAAILVAAIALGIVFSVAAGGSYWALILIILLAGILGVMVVIPIGGADMPVVISLLNSYSGLAACAAGFVLNNNVLIVSGALVGASGIILTQIMCKAMNRSLPNVLFGGVGGGAGGTGQTLVGEPKPVSVQDAYYLLEAANSVVVIPGYGMAVAQAQHVVRELAEIIADNGAEVKFAIHAVAGRMPGHMNVLLAEADVPYEQLVETEDVNPLMSSVDIALVIGANDVVNPAAREDQSSPLYGMPIINVDQARTTIVLKRSMKAGFAGVDNPLFISPNTRMLFGDAKQSLQGLVAEFKG